MALSFQGFILRPPQVAQSNASTTASATTGVVRDVKGLHSSYELPGPPLVDVAAAQYRAAILDRGGSTEEFLVFAERTGNLTTCEGTILQDEASGSIVGGTSDAYDTNISGVRTDASDRVVIIDDGNRSIREVTQFDIDRGDGGTVTLLLSNGDFTFNQRTGIATIDPSVLGSSSPPPGSGPLGGGVSNQRGDRVLNVIHTLSSVMFWWTKNDQSATRFLFNGRTQRWEPLKGSTPRDLGDLLTSGSYVLSPTPNVEIGSFLPGDSSDPDSYSMIRIGSSPGATSTPITQPVGPSGFGGIEVVADDSLSTFDFASSPTLAGVVGRNGGEIRWNPSFLEQFSGQRVWYSHRSFVEGETGLLGDLADAGVTAMFIAPIPGPTDLPFIRLGSRGHLEPTLVSTDAELLGLTVSEGEVGVSLATGRIRLSAADIDKADPDSQSFDVKYLGTGVFYTGVSLTQTPLPVRSPVRLVDENGSPAVVGQATDLFIPNSQPLPLPGVSGVLSVPDSTGTLPNLSSPPGIRPNGSGLLRDLESIGDLILFTESGVFDQIEVVDTEADLPRFGFKVAKGRAVISRENGTHGSKVKIGDQDKARFSGEPIFLLQAEVTPSIYAREARILSRIAGPYGLAGDEILKFSVNGNEYLWDASSDPGGVSTSLGGTFSAADIATSLDSVMIAGGSAVVVQDRVAIQAGTGSSPVNVGSVEIGFGSGSTQDLSGPSALGFLPGWRVKVSDPPALGDANWLSDCGASLGLFRCPTNLARTDGTPDFKHRARLEDVTITESVMASPVVLIDNPPLEDEAGYDDGVFFAIREGTRSRGLQNFVDVYHQFNGDSRSSQPRFSWAEQSSVLSRVEKPTSVLNLGKQLVVPETMHQGVGDGLSVSEDGEVLVLQELGEDFLLDSDGATGQVILIDRISGLVDSGANGSFSSGSGTFTDGAPDTDFVSLGVTEGYKLKVISGDSEGYYRVVSAPTQADTLEVEPNFPSSSPGTASWEILDGAPDSQDDCSILVDQFFEEFSHLPSEPFIVRVLDNLGSVPSSNAAQVSGRLSAVVSDAVASGRAIAIRYGVENLSPTSSLVALSSQRLGVIANGSLSVPGAFPATERFVNGSFSVRVGTRLVTFGSGNLIKISNIADPVGADQIGVLEAGAVGDGELKFGTGLLSDLAQSDVFYVEEFSDPDSAPNDLPEGITEFKVDTGELNFSAPGMASHGGTTAYFVEQMVTEGGRDVAISPMNGAFSFASPLREGQIVEATYFQDDGSGSVKLDDDGDPIRVVEFLPVYVRLDRCTISPEGVDASNRWTFNPDGNTVVSTVDPQVFVNGNLIGFLGFNSVVFDFGGGFFEMSNAAAADDTVEISYAILEATGGETSYTVSQPPIYRPPFFLEAGTSTFTLEGDRTGDMVPGKLLRVGASPFYVVSSLFDSSSGETTVQVFPQPIQEAGSRSPGNDVITVLSVSPISTSHSQDAKVGFFHTVIQGYDPVSPGSISIVLHGVTEFSVPGHMVEVGGYPFVIADAEISEDGRKTTITTTTPSPRQFSSSQDVAKISVRPVYPPSPRRFLGRGPIVPTETLDVVLFGEQVGGQEQPGRVLREGVDYSVDYDTGDVELLLSPLSSGQSIHTRHTRLRTLAPFTQDGATVYPRYKAGFSFVSSPSDANGYLGKELKATYTFSSPDSFYFRVVPLLDFLPEVSSQSNSSVEASNPSSGPTVALGGGQSPENFECGRLGLEAQLVDLNDTDRVARSFLHFYNESVVSFEQVLETISGDVIGDRDGKFRFFLGRGLDYAPPGYECPFSGNLNSRNVYFEVFLDRTKGIVATESDPLVDPDTALLVGNELQGDLPDPDTLRGLVYAQRSRIRNDVDDTVLVGQGRIESQVPPYVFPKFSALGRFEGMARPHAMSRLFPESATAFTVTSPGIGADLDNNIPGVYSRGRYVTITGPTGERTERKSTTGKSIATVSNPVLGTIRGITSIEIRDRLPRARVWAYSATGFPEMDAVLGTTTAGRAACIATPLLIKDFPVDIDTGLPDVSRLQSQGGDVIDLDSGDPGLFTPPLVGYDADDGSFPKVAFGKPDGSILDVGVNELSDPNILGLQTMKSVFVEEVQVGCVILFQDEDGDDVTEILVMDETRQSGEPIDLESGDTIFVVPPDVELLTSDPPTMEEVSTASTSLPGYRIGVDVDVNYHEGTLVDRTYQSFSDPSILGLKELFGQKPPSPVSDIEMDVTFGNSRVEPVEFPALLGEPKNDDGDYGIPYLSVTDTEIQRLTAATPLVRSVLETDSPEPGAVYPDEVLGADGQILRTPSGSDVSAALLTSRDLTPVDTAGSYTAGSAVGDVRPYDLVLVETGQSLPGGSMGILSVGDVQGGASGSVLEPPRFVTSQSTGRIRYGFSNIITHIRQGSTGLVVSRTGNITSFDGTAIPGTPFYFNDGDTASNGGLLNILDPSGALAYPNNRNEISINLFRSDTGQYLQTVLVAVNNGSPQVTGDAGTQSLSTVPVVLQRRIDLDTPSAFVTISLAPGPGELPEDPGNPGYTLPLWFTIDVDATDDTGAGGTYSATILDDRLTFRDGIDMRTVLGRSTQSLSGRNVHGQLEVTTVSYDASTENVTVNAPAEVNGGYSFTFSPRIEGSDTIGTFDPAPGGTGFGTVKVMPWEGFENSFVSSSQIVFSAIPSSDYDENEKICVGSGFCESETVVSNPDLNAYYDFDNRIASPTAVLGSVGNVLPGDVVVIKTSATDYATTKAGTYLVRYVVEGSGAYREETITSTDRFAGQNTGFAYMKFPTLVSSDVQGSAKVVISTAKRPGGGDAWPASGRVYFIRDRTQIDQTISIEYTSVNHDTGEFSVTPGSGEDENGAAVLDSVFDNAEVGILVSGFTKLEIQQRNAAEADPTFPSDHIVGYRGDGSFLFGDEGSALGYRTIQINNSDLGGAGVTYTYGSTPGVHVGLPLSGGVGVVPSSIIDNTEFNSDEDPPVYRNTGGYVTLDGVTSAQWTSIHNAAATAVDALFPGDTLTAVFRAQTAIFLEPSFPRPVENLCGTKARVVSSSFRLDSGNVGFRSGQDFGILPDPAPSGTAATPEEIKFEVRRIRRFSDVLDHISEQLSPLRYAYEIRRGTVTDYGPASVPGGTWPFVLTATGRTQVGGFDEEGVNIAPGDEIRLVSPSTGLVLDRAEVSGVIDSENLMLSAPGFTLIDPGSIPGLGFQVFIRTAPVPHEQSCEQLLELMTDEEVVRRDANYSTGDGGFAPQTNTLMDLNGGPNLDFAAAGVVEGDILVVDPQGQLEGQTGIPPTGTESGARPFGDTSVQGRVSYVQGRPSELDDNRGFYRIEQLVSSDTLEVSGVTKFSGDDSADVVFGTTTETKYGVYPTVRTPGFVEGQADLRATSYAGENGSPQNSFKGNYLSVAPFSYRIIRPNSTFSVETQDLILFMRERVLTWIEKLGAMIYGTKTGSYFVFQRDDHIGDLGDPSVPDDGLGVPSNALIESLLGLDSVSPFASTNDCMSFLDRRFWILDLQLDVQRPGGALPTDPTFSTFESNEGNPLVDVGEGRPVLPDLVNDVLDSTEQLRQMRQSWISFRVDLRDGTLSKIRRFEGELPRRLLEQQRLFQLNRGFGGVS